MSNKNSHKTRRITSQVSLLIIMITRGDVQRVVDAFILEETLYWWLHPIERVNTVRAIDAWDGYHWRKTTIGWPSNNIWTPCVKRI